MTLQSNNTMSDMIVDFPPQRNHRAVRFADSAQLYIVERHVDHEKNNNKIARHDLWNTNAEYDRMKRSIVEDVLRVRAQAMVGAPVDYAGDDDISNEDGSVCCVGIEHLLTPACALEVRACRARCIRAVAAAQARQDSTMMDIAFASFAQTRKAVLRARVLGKLLRDSL